MISLVWWDHHHIDSCRRWRVRGRNSYFLSVNKGMGNKGIGSIIIVMLVMVTKIIVKIFIKRNLSMSRWPKVVGCLIHKGMVITIIQIVFMKPTIIEEDWMKTTHTPSPLWASHLQSSPSVYLSNLRINNSPTCIPHNIILAITKTPLQKAHNF